MTDDLPDNFDLVVIGTGFTASCVAAAASRIGKSVLHIDQNDFYGGVWASFTLENLIKFFDSNVNPEIANCKYKWHIASEISSEVLDGAQEVSQKSLLEQSRRFSLDLNPRILYSAGDLVQLLITSNICRYAEFRAVDRVCTIYGGEIFKVPCSRSDVFNSSELGVIEKRMLMKFLTNCLAFSENQYLEDFVAFKDKTFVEYLQAQKLTEKIQLCIIQAIAMCSEETNFNEGIERTMKFLKSIGRYGNSPFLFPMYGCGEIPQCFCRLCAVFGGIYCLNKKIDALELGENEASIKIITEGKVVNAKNVVTSFGNIQSHLAENPTVLNQTTQNKISRAIIISRKPLGNEELNSGCGGVNILRLVDNEREALLIQLSHYSGTCPRDFYVFHFACPAYSNAPEEDIQPFLKQTLENFGVADMVLFSAFFSITGCFVEWKGETKLKTFLKITESPCYGMDYDEPIADARKIFTNLYPNQEFLPRAPDPEEIVVDGEDPLALNESSLPEDLRAHFRSLVIEQSMEINEHVQTMEED